MISIKKVIIFFIYLFASTICQEIPPYLIYSKIKKIKFDLGKDWINNSTMNSFRFDNLEPSKLVYESYLSFKKDVKYSLNCYNRVNLPNYFYAYAHVKIKSNSLNIFNSYKN